jgi:hypothetical protein
MSLSVFMTFVMIIVKEQRRIPGERRRLIIAE